MAFVAPRWIFCDFAEQEGVARPHGGQFWCEFCGSTEHPEV